MSDCFANSLKIAWVCDPKPEDIIIDIRHPEERNEKPLRSLKNQCLSIPFFELSSSIDSLDPKRSYLLYCEKGIMSRLQAITLQSHGFKVYCFTQH